VVTGRCLSFSGFDELQDTLPLFPPDTLRQKLSFRGVQPFASGTLLASYVPHR
jgi:hypothetical protein